MSELLGLLVGFLLTLFIYSYLIGDNPLYRIAVHLLVGVSAAYAAVIVVRTVFLPVLQRFQEAPTSPSNLLWLIPLFFGLLLLLSQVRPVAWMGNSTLALLVGVGAAVALVGAITGTLLPQIVAVQTDGPLLGLLSAVSTVVALLYFQFTSTQTVEGDVIRPVWYRVISGTGLAVLMITFGALFAGVFSTSLVLLVERVSFYLNEITAVLGDFLP